MDILNSNTQIYVNNQTGQPGTVGGFFKIRGEKGIFGITNFHIVESNGKASLDSPVFKVGTTDQIGALDSWYSPDATTINYFDLALFSVDQGVVQPKWNIPITGIADANDVQQVQLNLGSQVIHYGISEGLKPGPFPIPIAGKTYEFTNLLRIRSDSSTYRFSAPGDSGSLIVAGSKIVALLVGGDQLNPFISYAIPFIDRVSNKAILNYIPLTII